MTVIIINLTLRQHPDSFTNAIASRLNLFLTNKNNTVLYVGITNDLPRRCHEHCIKTNKGFASRYNINKLIYYELYDYPDLAIKREKQIKGYSRKKKVDLINARNPEWNNLLLK
jgi:putative endonuclease